MSGGDGEFVCTLFCGDVSIEWYRPRISTRNVASVFAGRPRYVLVDTTGDYMMLVPGNDGFFTGLEPRHVYLVPEVRETTASPVSPKATTIPIGNGSVAPIPVRAASSPRASGAYLTPPTSSASPGGSDDQEAKPTSWKNTLKGFTKDAKEKLRSRKKKDATGGTTSPSPTPQAQRKFTDDGMMASRRRSSAKMDAITLQQSLDKSNEGGARLTLSEDTSAFPGVRVHTTTAILVKVEAVRECTATSQPDGTGDMVTIKQGDVLNCLKCDSEGFIEVFVGGRTYFTHGSCVQVLPLDNATVEQKQLQYEIVQRSKRDRRASNAPTSIGRKGSAAPMLRKGTKDDSPTGSPSTSAADLHKAHDLGKSNSGREFNTAGVSGASSAAPDDEKLNPNSVYGKPLSGTGIPAPVRKCVEYFRRADHIQTEGIFRVPGSSNAVMRIRNKYLVDSVTEYEIPDDENPTVVASALKAFLFELPEPLISREQWYPLMEITDSRDFALEDAVNLFLSLPPQSVAILRYVFDFLADVAQYSLENKMSPANLGMVFGIVLLQPPDNNIANVGSSMPKEVCTFIVDNFDDIVEAIEQEVSNE